MAAHSELTTQQAADVLNVSHPFVVKLIDQGKLPARKVGTDRRVLLHDLIAFKQAMERDRLAALDQLTTLDQELGLGIRPI